MDDKTKLKLIKTMCETYYEEPKQDEESVRTRLSNLLYIWDKQHYGGITPCVDFLMENGVTFKEDSNG